MTPYPGSSSWYSTCIALFMLLKKRKKILKHHSPTRHGSPRDAVALTGVVNVPMLPTSSRLNAFSVFGGSIASDHLFTFSISTS